MTYKRGVTPVNWPAVVAIALAAVLLIAGAAVGIWEVWHG